SLWDFIYSGAEHFQTMVNMLPDVDFLIRTAYPEKMIKVEALFNYVSKRFDPSTHVSFTANNKYAT
ncbi:hypothetical protein, partial [Lactobacillus equicursoris]|uniref:hypothetical protein n=1 Tax=Lactobacillus equicursoris TaxID=420645 RepID=UPI000A9701E7